MEKLLEDLLFEAPEMQMAEITITESYVNDKLAAIVSIKTFSQIYFVRESGEEDGILIRKTRQINELLQQKNTFDMKSDLPYDKMAMILGDVLDANSYIINNEGTLLAQ